MDEDAMSLIADLQAAAHEEMQRALALSWRQLVRHIPWGDTFEGFTPRGRAVSFERGYLWDESPGGDIRVEVTVYEAHAYEQGVRQTRLIRRNG